MKTAVIMLAVCAVLSACVMPPPPLKLYNLKVVNISEGQSPPARLYIPHKCSMAIDGKQVSKMQFYSIDETLLILDSGAHRLKGKCSYLLSKEINETVSFDEGKTYRLFFTATIDESNSSVFKVDISGRVHSVIEEVNDMTSNTSGILDVLWTLENPHEHSIKGRKVFFDQIILSRSGMYYRKTSSGDTSSYIITSLGSALRYKINFDTSSLVFYKTDDSFNMAQSHTASFKIIDGSLIFDQHFDFDPTDKEITYKISE